MAFTREQWARDFLVSLGNPAPDQATVDWVVGWTVNETGTGGGARFNLLNTTEQANGSTFFNYLNAQKTFGVQNYPDYQTGISENARVLGENFGGYADLKDALVHNNIVALSGPSSGVRQGLTTWCGGCGYGVGFQASGAAHRNDSFDYGAASCPVPGFFGVNPCAPGVVGSSTPDNSPPPCPLQGQWWVIGDWYCLGWNATNDVAGVAKAASNDPLAIAEAILNSIVGKVMLFALGLFLIWLGFRLLFGSQDAGSATVDKLAGALEKKEGSAPPPTQPAQATPAPAQPKQKSTVASRAHNAEVITKAAVAA